MNDIGMVVLGYQVHSSLTMLHVAREINILSNLHGCIINPHNGQLAFVRSISTKTTIIAILTHLIDQQRVGLPLEQGLDHLYMTVLARQEERGEPGVVDAVHAAEFI